MFVAIYINGELDADREEIEDLIKDALMDKGKDLAKVTGGGSWDNGCNIDIEVDDVLGVDETLRRIRDALQASEEVPRNTDIAIEDKTFPLYPKKQAGKRKGKPKGKKNVTTKGTKKGKKKG
jgi:hypothetical protein